MRMARAGQCNTGRSAGRDRKSTRLNSSHITISYAVFCLKKKKKKNKDEKQEITMIEKAIQLSTSIDNTNIDHSSKYIKQKDHHRAQKELALVVHVKQHE